MPRLKHLKLEILPVRGISYSFINQLAEMLINNVTDDNPKFRYKYIQLQVHLSSKNIKPSDYLQSCKITKSVISDFVISELVKSFKKLENFICVYDNIQI
jgi:hypothetical protein